MLQLCCSFNGGTSNKTHVRLTTDRFNMIQFDKSFISLELDLKVRLDPKPDMEVEVNGISEDTDPHNIAQVFLGFKNGCELFDHTLTLVDNLPVGNQNNDAVREQFAYNVNMTRSQKETRKYSHSPYSNVSTLDPSVCGIYIPVSDLADGLDHDYRFEINVPFTDFLKYQAFTLYPNTICGEVEEELQTSTLGMVWAPIDPVVVLDHERKLHDLGDLELAEKEYNITRKFVQLGNPAFIPVKARVPEPNKLSIQTGKATLTRQVKL